MQQGLKTKSIGEPDHGACIPSSMTVPRRVIKPCLSKLPRMVAKFEVANRESCVLLYWRALRWRAIAFPSRVESAPRTDLLYSRTKQSTGKESNHVLTGKHIRLLQASGYITNFGYLNLVSRCPIRNMVHAIILFAKAQAWVGTLQVYYAESAQPERS